MSSYSFQIYEALDKLRAVEANLKFAAEYRHVEAMTTEVLAACYEQRQYLMSQLKTAVQMHAEERRRRDKNKPQT